MSDKQRRGQSVSGAPFFTQRADAQHNGAAEQQDWKGVNSQRLTRRLFAANPD
jgi:hypothetical protein